MRSITRLIICVLAMVPALHQAATSQAPGANRPANSGILRQITAGHYVYSVNNAGRIFNSGVIATSEGALVFDALDSEPVA